MSRLVVGLGNPSAGDDAAGWYLSAQLAADPRLPADVEVLRAGTDLLRLELQLVGRSDVIFVDACSGMAPGSFALVPHTELRETPDGRQHAHHLSAVDAVDVLVALGRLDPRCVRWALVGVQDVRAETALSDAVRTALPAIAAGLLTALRAEAA